MSTAYNSGGSGSGNANTGDGVFAGTGGRYDSLGLPEDLQEFFYVVAGMRWLEAQEGAMREMAEQGWDQASQQLALIMDRLRALRNKLDVAMSGSTAQSYRDWLSKTISDVDSVLEAMANISDTVTDSAADVEKSKIMTIVMTIVALASWLSLIASIIFAFMARLVVRAFAEAVKALVRSLMTALTTRVGARKAAVTLGRMTMEMSKHAAGDALLMGALDYLIQWGQTLAGHRDEVNMQSVGNMMLGGAIGGAGAGMVSGLGKMIGNRLDAVDSAMQASYGRGAPGSLYALGDIIQGLGQMGMVAPTNILSQLATGGDLDAWEGVVGGMAGVERGDTTTADGVEKLAEAFPKLAESNPGLFKSLMEVTSLDAPREPGWDGVPGQENPDGEHGEQVTDAQQPGVSEHGETNKLVIPDPGDSGHELTENNYGDGSTGVPRYDESSGESPDGFDSFPVVSAPEVGDGSGWYQDPETNEQAYTGAPEASDGYFPGIGAVFTTSVTGPTNDTETPPRHDQGRHGPGFGREYIRDQQYVTDQQYGSDGVRDPERQWAEFYGGPTTGSAAPEHSAGDSTVTADTVAYPDVGVTLEETPQEGERSVAPPVETDGFGPASLNSGEAYSSGGEHGALDSAHSETDQRSSAPVVRHATEVPASGHGGQDSAQTARVRFDVRVFETEPGRWITELSAPVDFVASQEPGAGQVPKAQRDLLGQRMQAGVERTFNTGHQLPDGTELRFALDYDTPAAARADWRTEAGANIPITVSDSPLDSKRPEVDQHHLDVRAPTSVMMHEVAHMFGMTDRPDAPGIMGSEVWAGNASLSPEDVAQVASLVDGLGPIPQLGLDDAAAQQDGYEHGGTREWNPSVDEPWVDLGSRVPDTESAAAAPGPVGQRPVQRLDPVAEYPLSEGATHTSVGGDVERMSTTADSRPGAPTGATATAWAPETAQPRRAGTAPRSGGTAGWESGSAASADRYGSAGVRRAHELGFTVTETVPDGDCFFDALDSSLLNSGLDGLEVRLGTSGRAATTAAARERLAEDFVRYAFDNPELFTGVGTEPGMTAADAAAAIESAARINAEADRRGTSNHYPDSSIAAQAFQIASLNSYDNDANDMVPFLASRVFGATVNVLADGAEHTFAPPTGGAKVPEVHLVRLGSPAAHYLGTAPVHTTGTDASSQDTREGPAHGESAQQGRPADGAGESVGADEPAGAAPEVSQPPTVAQPQESTSAGAGVGVTGRSGPPTANSGVRSDLPQRHSGVASDSPDTVTHKPDVVESVVGEIVRVTAQNTSQHESDVHADDLRVLTDRANNGSQEFLSKDGYTQHLRTRNGDVRVNVKVRALSENLPTSTSEQPSNTAHTTEANSTATTEQSLKNNKALPIEAFAPTGSLGAFGMVTGSVNTGRPTAAHKSSTTETANSKSTVNVPDELLYTQVPGQAEVSLTDDRGNTLVSNQVLTCSVPVTVDRAYLATPVENFPERLPPSVQEGTIVETAANSNTPIDSDALVSKIKQSLGISEAWLTKTDRVEARNINKFFSADQITSDLERMAITEHQKNSELGWVESDTLQRDSQLKAVEFRSRRTIFRRRAIARRVYFLHDVDRDSVTESENSRGFEREDTHTGSRGITLEGLAGPGTPFGTAGAGLHGSLEKSHEFKSSKAASTVRINRYDVSKTRYMVEYDLQVQSVHGETVTIPDAFAAIQWAEKEDARAYGIGSSEQLNIASDGSAAGALDSGNPAVRKLVENAVLKQPHAAEKILSVIEQSQAVVPRRSPLSRLPTPVSQWRQHNILDGWDNEKTDNKRISENRTKALENNQKVRDSITESRTAQGERKIHVKLDGRFNTYHWEIGVKPRVAGLRIGDTVEGNDRPTHRRKYSHGIDYKRTKKWSAGPSGLVRITFDGGVMAPMLQLKAKPKYGKAKTSTVGWTASRVLDGRLGGRKGGRVGNSYTKIHGDVTNKVTARSWVEKNSSMRKLRTSMVSRPTTMMLTDPATGEQAPEVHVRDTFSTVVETGDLIRASVIDHHDVPVDSTSAQFDDVRINNFGPLERDRLRRTQSPKLGNVEIIGINQSERIAGSLRDMATSVARAELSVEQTELINSAFQEVRLIGRQDALSEPERVDISPKKTQGVYERLIAAQSGQMIDPVKLPYTVWQDSTEEQEGKATLRAEDGTEWALDMRAGVILFPVFDGGSTGSGTFVDPGVYWQTDAALASVGRKKTTEPSVEGKNRVSYQSPSERKYLVQATYRSLQIVERSPYGNRLRRGWKDAGKQVTSAAEQLDVGKAYMMVTEGEFQAMKALSDQELDRRASELADDTPQEMPQDHDDVAHGPESTESGNADGVRWSLGMRFAGAPIHLTDAIPKLKDDLIRKVGKKEADSLIPESPTLHTHDNYDLVVTTLKSAGQYLGDALLGSHVQLLRSEDRMKGHTYALEITARRVGALVDRGRSVAEMSIDREFSSTVKDNTDQLRSGVNLENSALPFLMIDSTAESGVTATPSGMVGQGARWQSPVQSSVAGAKTDDNTVWEQHAFVSGSVRQQEVPIRFDVAIRRSGKTLADWSTSENVALKSIPESIDSVEGLVGQPAGDGDPRGGRGITVSSFREEDAVRRQMAEFNTAADKRLAGMTKGMFVEDVLVDGGQLVDIASEVLEAAGGKVSNSVSVTLGSIFSNDFNRANLLRLFSGEHRVSLPDSRHDLVLRVRAGQTHEPGVPSARIRIDSGDRHVNTTSAAYGYKYNGSVTSGVGPAVAPGAAGWTMATESQGQRPELSVEVKASKEEEKAEHTTGTSSDRPQLTSSWIEDIDLMIAAVPKSNTYAAQHRAAGVELNITRAAVIRRDDRLDEIPDGVSRATRELATADRAATEAFRSMWDAVMAYDEARSASGGSLQDGPDDPGAGQERQEVERAGALLESMRQRLLRRERVYANELMQAGWPYDRRLLDDAPNWIDDELAGEFPVDDGVTSDVGSGSSTYWTAPEEISTTTSDNEISSPSLEGDDQDAYSAVTESEEFFDALETLSGSGETASNGVLVTDDVAVFAGPGQTDGEVAAMSERLPRLPGTLTLNVVLADGGADVAGRYGQVVGFEAFARTFGSLLGDYPRVLLSVSGAAGFAEALSRETGVEVIAADGTVWMGDGGRLHAGPTGALSWLLGFVQQEREHSAGWGMYNAGVLERRLALGEVRNVLVQAGMLAAAGPGSVE